MEKGFSNDPILAVFIYETEQNIEQLEKAIFTLEDEGISNQEIINEIFRIMHTIKGSSAMMLYDNIALLAHHTEDLFYYIRDEGPKDIDCSYLSDLVLEAGDFVKVELEKIKKEKKPDGNALNLIEKIENFLESIKNGDKKREKSENEPYTEKEDVCYVGNLQNLEAFNNTNSLDTFEVTIFFEEGCEMENIRAFSIVHNLKDISENYCYYPSDIIENNESARVIREKGFKVILKTLRGEKEIYDLLLNTAFIKDFEISLVKEEQAESEKETPTEIPQDEVKDGVKHQLNEVLAENRNTHKSIISVDVEKLDRLMDLMGEMVIAEAMVTQNPDLGEINELENFQKAARQLRKITDEMQDMVMSIRMVPLSASFHKMQRLVRDTSRKLGKKVELRIVGEETEVDKNIIEHISDPLMHLVRNAVDHGIEAIEKRIDAGKKETGTIVLEAKNAGSDVVIMVKDDGGGIDKEKIFKKAYDLGLINKKRDEITDKEIYNLILLPGFSTNDEVTEYSGRGVGMDVVVRNLEAIGGSVYIDSKEGEGTVTTLKIPLTLAIIDGMNIRVGESIYTLPTISIKETFRPLEGQVFEDPDHNEMIMVRGECYSLLRLKEVFEIEEGEEDLEKGIVLMLEQDDSYFCLFADELLGQHQVVVKSLPLYMVNIKKVEGLAGCTLLGDGSISLILNIGGLMNMS